MIARFVMNTSSSTDQNANLLWDNQPQVQVGFGICRKLVISALYSLLILDTG